MRKLILAIDYDGTITDHAFPEIGNPMPYAVEVIKELKKQGHKLILWTAREDEVPYNINTQYLTNAVNWCKERGLEFDAINTGLPEDDWRGEHTLKRKPHVDFFIDDRNIGGFLGWEKIGRILLGDEKMDQIMSPPTQTIGISGIESAEEILLFKN